MLKAKIVFYNPDTGEILAEEDRVIFIGRKPYLHDRNFVKVFVAFLADILEDRELGTGAWRLLLYFVKNMEYNSLRVYLIPQEAAEHLGVTKRTIYNWLRVLLNRGYIEKLAVNVYRIKPYIAVKGSMQKVLQTEPDF